MQTGVPLGASQGTRRPCLVDSEGAEPDVTPGGPGGRIPGGPRQVATPGGPRKVATPGGPGGRAHAAKATQTGSGVCGAQEFGGGAASSSAAASDGDGDALAWHTCSLSGTAEMPLAALFADSCFHEHMLPIKYHSSPPLSSSIPVSPYPISISIPIPLNSNSPFLLCYILHGSHILLCK